MKALGKLPALFVWLLFLSGPVLAAEIFYESFESPVVGSERDATDPTNWSDVSPVGNRAGLGNLASSSYTNMAGNQAAWLNVYNATPVLETTSAVLSDTLLAEHRYTLRFNLAGHSGYTVYADLYAGGNVVLTAAGSATDLNFSNTVVSASFLPKTGDIGVGGALKIRLRVTGGEWNQEIYVDNLSLDEVDTSEDSTAPSPDPLTWVDPPTAAGKQGVLMTCSVATDENWVEYYFMNTVNGHNSGWIDVTTWLDTGLQDDYVYTYWVKARDRSVNSNETAWSAVASVTSDWQVLFYDSFELPVVVGQTSLSDPADWNDASTGGSLRCGLGRMQGSAYSGFKGHQAAWLNVYGTTPILETTIANLDEDLVEKGTYILMFNGADTQSYVMHADLLAGTNVVLTASVTPSSQNFASHQASNSVFVAKGAPGIEEPLSIRMRVTGGTWDHESYIDNLKLHADLPPPKGTVVIIR